MKAPLPWAVPSVSGWNAAAPLRDARRTQGPASRHLPFDSEEETNQLEGRLSMAFPPVIMGS